ncbi:MAG: hypothetical protein IJZ07_08225 [Clostridia bacterium]|nr:hypothetical protein [Clostridia bacterium]
MDKKKLFKSTGFWCFAVAIAEFLLFLIWGLNIQGGDEMGFSLITIYAAIPLTALILCTLLAAKKSKAAIALALLMILIEIFLPFFIFGTFEIGLSLCLSAIPCAAGLIFGYFISKKN